MEQQKIEEITEAWIKYHQLSNEERKKGGYKHPLFAAGFSQLHDLLRDSPEDAWLVVWNSMQKDIWERVCIATGNPTERELDRGKKKKEKKKKHKGRRKIK